MTSPLANYWSRLHHSALGWTHPDDEFVLAHEPHSFNLDFPPPAFVGAIASAKILILLANGGYRADVTPEEFAAPDAIARYLARLSHPESASWGRLSSYFDSVNYGRLIASGDAAIVNACAYRSHKISREPDNRAIVGRLPSIRYNQRWLVKVALPRAESGKLLIVGKRWGLWRLPPSVTSSPGYIADAIPESPHLSKVVLARIRSLLDHP